MTDYYEHSVTKDTMIPYSFECENCMKNSGNLQAHIVGEKATYNSISKKISDARTDKLAEEAYKNLVVKVKKIYKDATEKEIYWTEFIDECPYCHNSQSWGVSGLKRERFYVPIILLGVGIIAFIMALIMHYVSDPVEISLPVAFGILGAFVVFAIVSLMWNTIKINKKVKATSANGTKNIPHIDWSVVKELLNEET